MRDSAAAEDGGRCCGVRLNSGIRAGNMAAFCFGAFMTLGVSTSCNSLQPYLMTNFLGIDSKRQGEIGAAAKTLGEVATFLSAGAVGVLGDRIGRRTVYVLGFLVMALGLALLPFSRSIPVFYLFTVTNVLGSATAATMMATLPGDYAVPEDRGKANGAVVLMGALGVLCLGLVAGRLPMILGHTPVATADGRGEGTTAYCAVAALAVLTALALACGLADARAEGADAPWRRASMVERLRAGLPAARRQGAGVLFACLVAAVARADGQITALFMPQWCVSVALQRAAAGLPAGAELPEAQRIAATHAGLARGSGCVAVVGAAGLLAGALWGRVADRVDSAMGLRIALLLSGLSYGLVSLIGDPFKAGMVLAASVLGFSQTCTVISSQVFVQERAPVEVRGTILGLFATCGGLGQIVNVLIGGLLFSQWTMRGPFLWMAAVNAAVLLLGVAMRRRLSLRRASPEGASEPMTAGDASPRCEGGDAPQGA